jgi:RimJ/RimL family protein N-acetyltransferase
VNDSHVEDFLAAVGDRPETVVVQHLLRRGWGQAWVCGSPDGFGAAVVESTLGEGLWPAGEPTGLGRDPAALWEVLCVMRGWDCVVVDEACASPLAELMRRDTGRTVRLLPERCLALTGPVREINHDDVRRLKPDDAPIMAAAAPPQMRGEGWPGPDLLLRDGLAAGAVVDGRLVAIASTCARAERHAEIQIYTLEEWRGRGLASAAASLVARRIVESGQTPVWMAAEDNAVSRHIAQKIGFTDVWRRVYVIPERVAADGVQRGEEEVVTDGGR